MVRLRSEIPEEHRQLYSEYDSFDAPELYQEMVRRSQGKIKVLALDLEYTLITRALTQWPRPGLYAFLEAVNAMFDRVVIYTAVAESLFREVANNLVREGDVPEWFADIEYIDWPRKGYKDLSSIPGIESHEALIVDDYRPYIHPEQLFQWIHIPGYESINSRWDTELDRVLGVLELIHLKTIRRDRVLSYLEGQVDGAVSGIQKLWIYGPISEGRGDADSTLEVAMQLDPEEKVQAAKHIPDDQSEKNIQHAIESYLWMDVEFVDRKEDEKGFVIENTWEPFYAVFTRSPGRINIIFPDLPGCEGEHLKEDGDESFDKFLAHAFGPAGDILDGWLQGVEKIPEQRFSREELKKLYPDSAIHKIYGQLPWKAWEQDKRFGRKS